MKQYYVYILSNWNNKVLYVGVTSDLIKRVYEHKNKMMDGFSKKYNVDKLVLFEETTSIEVAIQREKRIKNWKRDWKVQLIEENNPEWDDLYEGLL